MRIAYFILIFLFSCNSSIEKEGYILPYSDYTGKVTVLFNDKDGVPTSYDTSNRRLYEIPQNGVLKSKFSENDGFVPDNEDYVAFFVREKGGLKLLNIKFYSDSIVEGDSTKVYAFKFVNGRYGNQPYLSFYIDSLKNIERISFDSTAVLH